MVVNVQASLPRDSFNQSLTWIKNSTNSMSSGSQIITEYSGASRETLVSTNSFNEDMLILFAAMVSFPQTHLLRARRFAKHKL